MEKNGVGSSGLEDVVAATTRLSDVDGAHGRLVIAGRAVEQLAGSVSFEQLIVRLFFGREADPSEIDALRSQLGAARERAFERMPELGDALKLPDPMDSLRAATAHVTLCERPGATPQHRLAEALELIGAIAVFATHWNRDAQVRPSANASHAADYLRMMRGEPASAAEIAALDSYLVTVADHGMNASTFTARVVASTASDAVSAVVAALGALKGRLHGGAPGPVLDMLDAIGAGEPRVWLEAELARGERIMGMGHRVYRVRDPRAFVLERAVRALEHSHPRGATAARLALARAVESEAERLLAARHPDRPLRANVEFYTAILLEAIGLPRASFTPTFAVGRVAGWCAHIDEQRRSGRLIRPQSRYVDASPI